MFQSADSHPRPKSHDCNTSGDKVSATSGDGCINGRQDHLLPIANVGRIMKQVLPPNAKVSKEAKETMQECATEFIGFVTGEASDRCRKERRKTINGDDICLSMETLGLDAYAVAMKRYLHRYREHGEQAASMKNDLSIQIDVTDELSIFRSNQSRNLDPSPHNRIELGNAKRFL